MDIQGLSSFVRSIFPPASKYTVDDVPDLTGRVVLVTGGNAGMGKIMCRILLSRNARVYMLSRSASKAADAVAQLKAATGKDDIHFIQCDLADLPTVKVAAEEFVRKEKQLHLLFNSAGVYITPMDMLTAQNYDLQFGTNVLGHAYLTKLLLPTVLATAKSSPSGTVRVITTSSAAHNLAPRNGILYDTLKAGQARDKQGSPALMYQQSKWADAVFAKELARRYGEEGIVSIAVDPGFIKTDVWKYQPWYEKVIFDRLVHDVELGALTPLFAGTSPDAAEMNGQFVVPWARVGAARRDTDDPGNGRRLWEWLEGEMKGL